MLLEEFLKPLGLSQAEAAAAAFHHEVGMELHRLSVKLADTPVGPLGYDRPRDEVRRQLSPSTLM